jgi:hypothetical protein
VWTSHVRQREDLRSTASKSTPGPGTSQWFGQNRIQAQGPQYRPYEGAGNQVFKARRDPRPRFVGLASFQVVTPQSDVEYSLLTSGGVE